MAATDKIQAQEQWVLESANGVGAPHVNEQWVLESTDGVGGPHVNEQWVLYAGTRAADFANVTEQWALTITDGNEVATPEVHEQWVLLVVDEQVPTTPVGAWTYEIDGHLFYGLNLGAEGTAVYDVTSNRWFDWRSGTLPWLNMNLTVVWKGETHGAALIGPNLVKFDPTSVLDDGFRLNQFIGSGRFEYEDRAFVAMPEAQILGSVGLAGGGDVLFRYSDNDGASFTADRTRTVVANDRGANVVFYDLGSLRAPGRIFEIEDAGTLKRIASLRVRLDGFDAGQE